MSCIKLASAGDDIKIWDIGDFSLVKQFNPHEQNVGAIAWNGKKSACENVLLCSTSPNSEKISFAAVKDTAVTVSEFDCMPGNLCVDFNSTSSYLLVGGEDSCINLWDLKSKKIKKTYKDHKGPVTCAQFNSNDTYIASGSETGEIILFNVVTGQGCSPMVSPRIQTIKQIQYSKFRKSLLGSVSDDGAVNLWDINTRRMLHSFTNSHIAPATGLNFSPINDILLMSVGLDKRIVCYDTQGKKPVKTMIAENPLTSIDVMADGATVAVGSTRGIIYIYDLRHGNAPMKIINAHKSSVQCLKFQHGISHETTTSAKSTSSSAVSPNRRQLPSAPGAKYNHNRDISEPYNINNHSDAAAGEDVFSPVRNDLGNSSLDIKMETGGNNSLFNTHSSRSNDSSGGLFSPLADGDSVSRRYGERIKVSPLVTNSSPVMIKHGEITASEEYQYNGNIHDDGIVRQNLQYSDSHHETEIDAQPYSNTRELPFTGNSHSFERGKHSNEYRNTSYTDLVSKPQMNTLGASTSYSGSVPRGKSPQSVSPRPQSIHNSRQASTSSQGFFTDSSPSASENFTASKKLDDSPSGSAGGQGQSPLRTSGTPDGAHAVSLTSNGALRRSQEGSASAASVPQNFQTQFIRNMIEDSMEDFKEQIHSQYLNLHLEMIRQFQIQQNEMTQLLQQYSVNHELIQEVERLREENKRLKKNF